MQRGETRCCSAPATNQDPELELLRHGRFYIYVEHVGKRHRAILVVHEGGYQPTEKNKYDYVFSMGETKVCNS